MKMTTTTRIHFRSWKFSFHFFQFFSSEEVMDLIKNTFDGSFYTRIFVPEQDEGSLA